MVVLRKIRDRNMDLRKEEFKEKKMQLQIIDYEEMAKDVKNYRVTK